MNKVAVIGAGAVGATLAYTLTLAGLVEEVVLIDIQKGKAAAESLDISHGIPLGKPVYIHEADYSACKDASVVAVTAGAKQRPGETRINLLERNVALVRSICESVYESGFSGVLLMISNPVDALTYLAWKIATTQFGIAPAKVFGSGTVLDSLRFRAYLAAQCAINPQNVHGYVLGEHGDTSFPAWSLTSIGGVSIERFCVECGAGCNPEVLMKECIEKVRSAANTIIESKGATYYGIAQAAVAIIQAVVRDERRIMPVSCARPSYHGIENTAFSFPAVIGKEGIVMQLDTHISQSDEKKLCASASFIASVIKKAGI